MDQVVRAGFDGVCMTKVTRPQDIHEAAALFDTLERHQGRCDASVAVGWQLVDKPILLRAADSGINRGISRDLVLAFLAEHILRMPRPYRSLVAGVCGAA